MECFKLAFELENEPIKFSHYTKVELKKVKKQYYYDVVMVQAICYPCGQIPVQK